MWRFAILLLCIGCAAAPAPRAPKPELRSFFVDHVQPIVSYRCAGCHGPRGCCSQFLAPRPDLYTAVKSWPHLVGPTPRASLLYTKGDHEGPAFPKAEAKVVEQWIRAEAR